MVNSITHIAFIECTLNNQWQTEFGYPNPKRKFEWSEHMALNDDATVSLVDIGQTRRYLSFKSNSKIQIINNVLVFTSYQATDITINEEKQFPKNQRIGD